MHPISIVFPQLLIQSEIPKRRFNVSIFSSVLFYEFHHQTCATHPRVMHQDVAVIFHYQICVIKINKLNIKFVVAVNKDKLKLHPLVQKFRQYTMREIPMER